MGWREKNQSSGSRKSGDFRLVEMDLGRNHPLPNQLLGFIAKLHLLCAKDPTVRLKTKKKGWSFSSFPSFVEGAAPSWNKGFYSPEVFFFFSSEEAWKRTFYMVAFFFCRITSPMAPHWKLNLDLSVEKSDMAGFSFPQTLPHQTHKKSVLCGKPLLFLWKMVTQTCLKCSPSF